MSDVTSLHKMAMDLAERALIERFAGNEPAAQQLFAEGFILEKKAALAVEENLSAEPSRSVLFRSAASMAMNCKNFREAERMIALALAGDPPVDIADELRDLYEQITFERHLDLRGVMLGTEELQLSLSGHDTGFGIIRTEEFLNRIQIVEKLAYRTAERKEGRPFRERGNVSKAIREGYEPYISVPRAASFAVTIRLGVPKEQGELFPVAKPSPAIIEDVITNVGRFNDQKFEALKEAIPDEAYLRNFIALTRDLAPDGTKVKIVGLTMVGDNQKKAVAFTRRRSEIPLTAVILNDRGHNQTRESEGITQLTGTLSYADADKQKIKLTERDGKKHNIVVPQGLLADIVRPYWETEVTVVGRFKRLVFHLEDIARQESSDDS